MTKPDPSWRFLALLALLGGCAAADDTTDPVCASGKCDDPGATANKMCMATCKGDAKCVQTCRDGAALEHCSARRADALASAQQAYTKDNIRWACADVAGVNANGRDDRGQEYCEYYAVVQAPPKTAGTTTLPRAVDLGRNRGDRPATSPAITLSDDQVAQLEDNADAVVGQCVFTSWHQDIAARLPICGSSDTTCPKLALAPTAKLPPWAKARELGKFRLTAEYMRMKVTINSNSAAADLFEKCMTDPVKGDPKNPADPLHDDYTRGCWKAYQTFQTEWRRSDPTVCAAGGRLAECGCGVDTNGDGKADITDPAQIARAVVPPQPNPDGSVTLRGFHLGTWSDPNKLPAGCRYLDTGDTSSTLVACDLSGSDVLGAQTDVKQKCREKYGDNVVVHVPVPAAAIVCKPPAGGQYSKTCSATPWVLAATK